VRVRPTDGVNRRSRTRPPQYAEIGLQRRLS
jgi:hypothetical protein